MPQPLQPSQLQQAGVSSSPMKARSSPMGSPLAERERSAEKSDSNFKRWLKKYVLVPKPHSASPLRESSATGNNVHRRLQLEATSSPQQRPSTAMASMTTTTTTLTPTSATMAGQRSPEKSVSNRVIVVPPIAQPIPSPVTGASAHRRTQTANTQYIVSVARIGGSGSTPPGSNPSSVNNRSVITTAVSSPLPAPLSLPVYSGTQSPLPLSPCPPAALSLSQSMSGTVHNTNTPRGRNGNLVVAAAAVAVPGALANAPLRAYELCFPSPPTPTFTLYCFDTLEVGQELKRMVWWCAAHEVCTMHLLVGIHGESPPPLVYSSSPALQRQGTTRGAGGAEESTDETEENEVSEEDVTPGRAQNTTNGSGQGSASRYRRPVPRHRRVSSSGTDSNNADSPTGTAAVYYDTVIMLLRADMWLRRRAVARRGRRAEGWIEVELPLHTIAEAKEKLWLQQLTCTGNTAGNGIRHSFFSLSEEEAASQQREIQEQQNTVR